MLMRIVSCLLVSAWIVYTGITTYYCYKLKNDFEEFKFTYSLDKRRANLSSSPPPLRKTPAVEKRDQILINILCDIENITRNKDGKGLTLQEYANIQRYFEIIDKFYTVYNVEAEGVIDYDHQK